MKITYLPHQKTNFFSKLNIDYLNGSNNLKPFYAYEPNDEGIKLAISDRKHYSTDRSTLVRVLKEQYQSLAPITAVNNNIELLSHTNTFTICSAHQPNLMTGYLYFIYKILHAVVLAQHVKTLHPDYNFVPVFYIGSEDNDLDELSVFRFNGIKFKWDTDQTGAVGRMDTTDLQPLLKQLTALIGPPGSNADNLISIINTAYNKHNTIAQATRYIVHELLGTYGVVVIDADHPDLKKQFIPIMEQELMQPVSNQLVQYTTEILNQQYSAQAFSRPINLFYLYNDIRERIEKTDDYWHVVRTQIKWSNDELLTELNNHPERFSPNVILRGLYQETILPNVAFIGGGSEVAYWLQLKQVFEHYKVFYPTVVLRQSALLADNKATLLQRKTGLLDEEIFEPTEKIIRSFVFKHSQKDLHLEDTKQQLALIFEQVKNKAINIDITLKSSAEAVLTKIRHQINTIEKKMMRAEKRNMAEQLAHIYKLRTRLFPNESLQERYDTFMPYYLDLGQSFFDVLKEATLPYGNRFAIIRY